MKKKIAMCCILVFAIGILTACGGESASPTDVATDFLTALQEGDEETLNRLYVNDEIEWELELTEEDGLDELERALAESIAEKITAFEFELSNEVIDGNTATVDVKITAYNLSAMLENWMEAYIESAFEMAMAGASEEEIEDLGMVYLEEALRNVAKDFVDTVQLDLVKVDGEWFIDEIDEEGDLINALTGGLLASGMF